MCVITRDNSEQFLSKKKPVIHPDSEIMDENLQWKPVISDTTTAVALPQSHQSSDGASIATATETLVAP
jgi:hypothetical protein